MFIAIAITWLWVTIAVLLLGALFLTGRFLWRLYLAIIMTRAWRREDISAREEGAR